MLYFSVGSDKETRPRRRRTEGLVLTPITSRGKLRLAPGVLFPILRYLQGAINKLLPETTWGMKGTECRSHRKDPQMKSLLKVCGSTYSSTMEGFRIIPGSTTRGPQALHTPPQKVHVLMNDPHTSYHYCILQGKFHCWSYFLSTKSD